MRIDAHQVRSRTVGADEMGLLIHVVADSHRTNFI